MSSRFENHYYTIPSFDLANEVVEGKVTIEQLKERFKAIKYPECNVMVNSPEEQFMVGSGALRVTDPCYEMDTWCAGTQENVKNGQWVAFVGTAFDKTDIKYSKKWIDEGIEKLAFEPDLEEAKKALGKDATEERVKQYANLRASFELQECLRRLLCLEDFYGSGEGVGRVWHLHIHHADHPIKEMDDTWEKSEIHVGVDSGQAGFADLEWFKDHQVAEGVDHHNDPEWEAFYCQFCDKTLETKHSFGCLSHAAVSSSGYGDGGYPMFLKRDQNGEVIAARIVYITNESCEDEEELPEGIDSEGGSCD